MTDVANCRRSEGLGTRKAGGGGLGHAGWLIMLAMLVATVLAGGIGVPSIAFAGSDDPAPTTLVHPEAQLLASGHFGESDSLLWEWFDDATMRISGSGAIPDYDGSDQPWNAVMTKIEHLEICDGVTAVGDYAFSDSWLLNVAWLPDGLASIGDHAFYKAKILTSIDIPESVTDIGASAFEASGLESCHLPENLREIPDGLFASTPLTQVNFPAGLTRIGNRAFMDTHVQDIALPSTLTELGVQSFQGVSTNAGFTIPSGIGTVTKASFNGLTVSDPAGGVTIGEGITAIERTAFAYVHLGYLRLPKSLSSINQTRSYSIYDQPALAPALDCAVIGQFVVDGENPWFSAVDGNLCSCNSDPLNHSGNAYEDKGAVLLMIATTEEVVPEVFVPDGVVEMSGLCLTSINRYSYQFCTLHIPASVAVNLEAFARQDMTKNIVIDDDNQTYSFADGVLYNKDKTHLFGAIPYLSGAYIMPNTVRTIATGAFESCDFLTEVAISNRVTQIPNRCFYACHEVINLYIPSSVTRIGSYAFTMKSVSFWETKFKNLYYGGTQAQWESLRNRSVSQTDIGNNSLGLPDLNIHYRVLRYGITGTGLIQYVKMRYDDGMTDPEWELCFAFDDAEAGDASRMVPTPAEEPAPLWQPYASRIQRIRCLDGVEGIASAAFPGCDHATELFVASSVGEVSPNACSERAALQDVICLGAPFSVTSASSQTPSFDAECVTIHCLEENAAAWKSSGEYDEDTGTWNGYAFDDAGDDFMPKTSLPILTTVSPSSEAVTVYGNLDWQWGGYDVPTQILDESGNDISPLVDISIDAPERTVPLTSPASWLTVTTDPTNAYYGCTTVTYDLEQRKFRVGRIALAGEYDITIAPKEGEATGEAKTFTITVTRDTERIERITSSGVSHTTTGRRHPSETLFAYTMDGTNQYGERVTDRCSFAVWDDIGEQDITDELDEWGLAFDPAQHVISASRMAMPRNYSLRISSADPTLLDGSPKPVPITISRSPAVLNVPYAMTLSGGNPVIETVPEGTWASVPYRVRCLDSFDDPCWPRLTWKVTAAGGSDVTGLFEVDEQGYLFVKPEAYGQIDEGDNQFTVTAIARDTYANKDVTASRALIVRKAPAVVVPATHEAIFVIGSEEVARVTFTEGDTSLTEPPMPPRENYVGSWEDYDLASLTDDITIHGTYEPLDPDKVSEVEGETDASYEDSVVTISLAATATTKTIRMETTRVRPVDMVLVLDQSGSMEESLGDTGKTKRDALVECAHSFVESLYDNAVKTGADHRVALVGFGCDATNGYDYRSTGLVATTDGASFKKYTRLTQSDYAKALIPIAKDGAINNIVTAGIDSVVADGATATDFGLKMASDIFSENPVGVDEETGEAARNRIVVLITDGEPTSLNPDYAECVRATSAAAIREARGLKDGAGAKVYSVGVHADANPQAEFVAGNAGIQSKRGYVGRTITEVTTAFDFNRFLHAVSSNYPAAESLALSDLGDGDKAGGYYMAVTDTSNLDRIFTSILYSTVYELGGFNKATLRYDLPASLAVTMRQDQEMRARLREEQGLTDEDISVEEQPDGTTRITFRNVPVRRVADDAGNVVYRAAVSFATTVLPEASGDVATGTAVIGADGSEGERVENISVDVPVDRCLLIFKVNEAIYEVREVAEGTEVTVPDTDLARWMELERLIEGGNAPVASVGAAEFATTTLTRKYNMTWAIGEQVVKESYEPGQPVTPPDGTGVIGTDQEISCWSPGAPATMPGHDMTCVATVTAKHAHSFTAGEYRTGTCAEGIVTHHVCACGAEVTEQAAPKEHSYEAIVSASSTTSETVEKLVCSDCGHSVDKHMQYQVSYAGGGWFGNMYPQYLQLDKYEHEVSANGESADDIQVRVYIPSNLANKRFTVTRIDADGSTKTYAASVGSDGYLTFYPDHFSLYYLEGLDEDEESDVPTYDEAMSAIGEGEDESSAPDVDVNAAPDGASTDDGSLDISAATADSISDQTLADGEMSAEPPVTGLAYDGNPLVKGTDYEVSYEGNTEPGTAYAVVTGKGLFLGTEKRIPFTVAGSQQDDGGNNGQGNNGSGSGSGNNGGSGSQSGSGSGGNGSSGGTSSSGSGSDGGSGSFAASGIFRDVSASTPHSEDIEWTAENGISTGWTEKDGTRTFRPTNSTIRADMAAFLFRVAKRWNVASDAWVPTDAQRKAFVDVNESTPHAKEIWWLASTGISTGWKEKDGTKTFRPYNKVVRQDMAAFLFRLAKVGRKGGATDSWKPSDAAKGKFSDVDNETSHHDEIWWLAETGVSKGWKVGDRFEFRGMEPIRRQDMAAFLRRMDGLG